MTEGAKNNYALVIKLDLTFFIFGVLFLKFSLVFLAAEEDYKTHKQKQSKVNELTTTYLLMPEFLGMLNSKINWMPKG